WKTSVDKENATFFPLRIGQKTKTCLNNHDFFVTIVVGNKNNTSLLGYLCQSDVYISQIENDPSRAISS
ncbi:6209_t:CDS:1, partial [Funneliformis mosseae]